MYDGHQMSARAARIVDGRGRGARLGARALLRQGQVEEQHALDERGETTIGPGRRRKWGPGPGLRRSLVAASLSSAVLASPLRVGFAHRSRDASILETVESCRGHCSHWGPHSDWGSSGHRSSLQQASSRPRYVQTLGSAGGAKRFWVRRGTQVAPGVGRRLPSCHLSIAG